MKALVVPLILLLFTGCICADVHEGQPRIVRFSPELDVYPQNFAITADTNGYVFIGNADGVLVFDGSSWQLTEMPNQEIVRWLAFDGDKRVYVGGFDAFGYIEANEYGEFHYEALSPKFADRLKGERFADIWRIAVTRQGVFFVGLEHLFHYIPETGETGFWKHEGSFGPITEFKGQTWLQWRGEGIKSYDGERWQLFAYPGLDEHLITGLVVTGNEMIVVNADSEWLRFDGEAYKPIPDSTDIPYNASGTHAFVAGDSTIGLATQLGEMVFYDVARAHSESIKVSSGFIPAAIQLKSGVMLAVDDLGFSSFNWPSRWKVIDEKTGLTGSISQIHKRESSLYALTSSGAFMRRSGDDNFSRLAWTDDEAWSMHIDADGETLFADSYTVKVISGSGDVSVITENATVRLFVASRHRPDIVYAGTEYGIQIFQKKDGQWSVVASHNDMDNLTVTQIVERTPNELWFGSARGGIYRVRFEDIGGKLEVQQISESEGLQYGALSEGAFVHEVNDELIASTSAGMFRFDGELFQQTDLFGLDSWRIPGETIELLSNGKELWAFHFDRLYRFDGEWREEEVSGLIKGAMTTIEAYGDEVLVGGLGSILVFDDSVAIENQKSSQISLTQVRVSGAEAQNGQGRLPLDDVRLSSVIDRVTLQFALTDFSRPNQVRFRSRLDPLEQDFTDWSISGQLSYVDLGPGEYTLNVEGRDSYGDISSIQVPVRVHPQWFETSVFRGGALGLLLFFSFLTMRFFANRNARRLRYERDVLEQRVAERTRALQSANQQLDQMAHLDGLTQIPNRRRLDTYLEDVRLQCVERNRVMALALIDVDHFKRFNDTQGHQAGDGLLIALAKLFSRNLRRAEDLVARYGGEEFLVVLPGADSETAYQVIEGMRANVAGSDLKVTVSAGLHVHTPDETTSIEDMIAKADAALYQAKTEGRNRVVFG